MALCAPLQAGCTAWRAQAPGQGAPRPLTQNPTLSLSFPVDAGWVDRHADQIESVLAQMQLLFTIHALVYAPAAPKPSLPGVESLRTLPYSNAEGRAMLARALQCQCHVELIVSNNAGYTCLSGANEADVAAYLMRLEQVARAVDALVVAFVPGDIAAQVRTDALRTAFAAHAVAQRPNMRVIEAADWADLAQALAVQRDAWS